MLDEKDLQAIAQTMDDKLSAQRKDIMRDVVTLMDAEFKPRFDTLAEGQDIILQKLERLEDMDIMDTRISALEAMVKKLNREMNQLKQAN